jgi:hypothetical protein
MRDGEGSGDEKRAEKEESSRFSSILMHLPLKVDSLSG